MSMKTFYNPQKGISVCEVYDRKLKRTFYGFAEVHPDDKKIATREAGIYIASKRALIARQNARIQSRKEEVRALENQLSFAKKQLAGQQTRLGEEKDALKSFLESLAHNPLLDQIVFAFVKFLF